MLGSDLSVSGRVVFQPNTYVQAGPDQATSGHIQWVAGGNKAMSLTSTGGILHGMWSADATISTSDRRLKTNIKPLLSTLQKNFEEVSPEVVVEDAKKKKSQPPPVEGKPLNWLLREMRPVSYNFKKGGDSKNVRFGFIADELERVLPQVVRTRTEETMPDGTPKKGIVYPDLIAVLTSAVKEFHVQLQALQTRVKVAEVELDRLDEEDPGEDEDEDDYYPVPDAQQV